HLSITWDLWNHLPVSTLDPEERFGTDDALVLVKQLWGERVKRLAEERGPDPGTPPDHLGIFTFPRLDTEDTLLYPILAHEFAHFIDSSYRPDPKHNSASLREKITFGSIKAVLGERGKDDAEVQAVFKRFSEYHLDFFRELLADVIATR